MFFKLNLRYVSIEYEEEKIIKIMYHNNNGKRVIMKENSISYVCNYNDCPLDIKYLPAIIQQYKELGWYE